MRYNDIQYDAHQSITGEIDPDTCEPDPDMVPAEWETVCQAISIPEQLDCNRFVYYLNGNALEAWGPKAATALGADLQLIATSGSGPALLSQVAAAHLHWM